MSVGVYTEVSDVRCKTEGGPAKRYYIFDWIP